MEVFVETKFKGIFINELGTVKSVGRLSKNGKKLKDRELEPSLIKGYYHINIGSKWVRLHRLLAEAFLEKVDSKNIVCHKNDIKTDNRLENLYWGNHSENLKDRYRNLGSFTSGENHPKFIKGLDVYIGLPSNFKRLLKSRGEVIENYTKTKYRKYSLSNQWIYKYERKSDVV